MYKKEKLKFAFWTVTQSLGEKKKSGMEFKLMRRKRLKELLLVAAGKRMDIYSKVCCCLDFFLVAVVVFFVLFFPLLCAVAMDSSKVGKCRIACCSCLSRGGGPKQNTHTHVTISTL